MAFDELSRKPIIIKLCKIEYSIIRQLIKIENGIL